VPFSAVFASPQTIRCGSRSQRLKRAREVCHKSSEKSTTSSMPALSLNAITRVDFCSPKTVLKPEAICAQPQRPPVLLRQSSVTRFARQTKRGVAAAEADGACAACYKSTTGERVTYTPQPAVHTRKSSCRSAHLCLVQSSTAHTSFHHSRRRRLSHAAAAKVHVISCKCVLRVALRAHHDVHTGHTLTRCATCLQARTKNCRDSPRVPVGSE
jgi:hypothetical protein